MTKLNLGCGQKRIPGYINCDVSKMVNADKYFDLNIFPYPFPDNYADSILLDNVLEHLENVNLVMSELHRILKPSGVLDIYVPYAKSDGALQDPTHTHLFTEKSMDYYTNKSPCPFYSTVKFKLLKKELSSVNKTNLSKLKYLIPFKRVLRYVLYNIYDQIYFMLQPIK